MKRAVRLGGVLVGIAVLVGGLAPSALAGRNVVKSVAYSSVTFSGCVIPVTVTTTKVPSDGWTVIYMQYTTNGGASYTQVAQETATASSDMRTFTYTFSGSALIGAEHMTASAAVYKLDHNGDSVRIGTGRSEQFSTVLCTAGTP